MRLHFDLKTPQTMKRWKDGGEILRRRIVIFFLHFLCMYYEKSKFAMYENSQV